MKPLIVGIIASVYVAMIGTALERSRIGWAGGHPDAGLWWAVIGGFLTIGLFTVVLGTWLTGRGARSSGH